MTDMQPILDHNEWELIFRADGNAQLRAAIYQLSSEHEGRALLVRRDTRAGCVRAALAILNYWLMLHGFDPFPATHGSLAPFWLGSLFTLEQAESFIRQRGHGRDMAVAGMLAYWRTNLAVYLPTDKDSRVQAQRAPALTNILNAVSDGALPTSEQEIRKARDELVEIIRLCHDEP